MQVATRWMIAERPAAGSELLPGADAQAQFEEQAQRRPVERRTRPLGRPEKVVVGEHPLPRDQRQRHDQRALEAAERVRLVRPVEPAGPRRVVARVMLAQRVIATDGCRRLGPAALVHRLSTLFDPVQPADYKAAIRTADALLKNPEPRSRQVKKPPQKKSDQPVVALRR